MALVVEDGSIVAGANTYISLATARDYATARGSSLPVDDVEAEVLVIKAMDYVESYRDRYKGKKKEATQETQWPRTNVYIDNYALPSDSIPQELVNAQCQLSIDAQNQELQPVGDGREVIGERVEGAVDVKYSTYGINAVKPVFVKALAFLQPLLKVGSGTSVVRV